jgi:hypothetical protein
MFPMAARRQRAEAKVTSTLARASALSLVRSQDMEGQLHTLGSGATETDLILGE